MNSSIAVILAAGEGTRMKSSKPKALKEVLFKPMLDWVIDAVKAAGIDEICIVTGSGAEYIEDHVKDDKSIITVRQTERLGTGHAVMQAVPFINAHDPCDVVVLNGDAPFIDAQTLKDALKYHEKQEYSVTVITSDIDNPYGYGRIIRDKQDDLISIIEEKSATDEQKEIKEVNSGAYCFKSDDLIYALSKITNDNSKGEYYLTETVSISLAAGKRAGAYLTDSSDTVLGANTRKQLNELNEIARNKIMDRLNDEGVDIPCRDGVMIGPDAEIGKDTVILPGTIITGKSVIGEGSVIGPNSYVRNSIIGDDTVFNNGQIEDAVIRDGCDIGPFVHVRPNSDIGNGVHLGNFVEVKNSNIDEDTKVSHLTYVGDSDVGSGVNFGCGVVTVNFNGKTKGRTVIKDGAFIGCNTNLVAPVTVGENSYTAAGSTITDDVPDNTLAIARERQTNKEDWVKKNQPYRRKV